MLINTLNSYTGKKKTGLNWAGDRPARTLWDENDFFQQKH